MPAAGTLTVKKADELTNVDYTALSGSPGDGQPARWRQDTGQSAAFPLGHRPVFETVTSFNGPRTARVARCRYSRPYSVLNSTTNVYESKHQLVGEAWVTMPQAIPPAELSEGVYQFFHLCAHSTVKSTLATGYNFT